MTEENFSLALKNYFEKYKWSNATLDNLISEMNKVVKEKNIAIDFISWKKKWICKAGLNTVEVKKADNKVEITQGFYMEAYKTIRPHSMKIGLFDTTGKIFDVLKVNINAKKTILEYKDIAKV